MSTKETLKRLKKLREKEHPRKYVPFPSSDWHPVIIHTPRFSVHVELINWINNHCNGKHSRVYNYEETKIEFWFEMEEDAVLFKLTQL